MSMHGYCGVWIGKAGFVACGQDRTKELWLTDDEHKVV